MGDSQERVGVKWRFFGGSTTRRTHHYTSRPEEIHLDSVARSTRLKYKDCTVNSDTGKFESLVVQCTDAVYDSNGGATWKRSPIKNISPWRLRLANWVLSSVDTDGRPSEWFQDWSASQWLSFIGIYIVAISLLLPALFFSTRGRGKRRNGGKFDSFPYSQYTRAKSYRNEVEDVLASDHVGVDRGLANSHSHTEQPVTAPSIRPGSNSIQPGESSIQPGASSINPSKQISLPGSSLEQINNETEHANKGQAFHEVEISTGVSERILYPRKLVVRESGDTERDASWVLKDVNEWKASASKNDSAFNPSYVFVAFASSHFLEKREDLSRIAMKATVDAQLRCYWLSSECIGDVRQDPNAVLDVFDISDVLRGAEKFVIAVPSLDTEYLKEWAQRLWTFPELLLSRGDQIYVCTQTSTKIWRRAEFIREFLPTEEAQEVRQLVEHYEGNLHLSALELTVIAIQCLSGRDRDRTQYLSGDYSYALMGLLRRRPLADPTDTPFLAFARLSLANHNDCLLERLICALPRNPDQFWHCMDDAYGAMLWDIAPAIQIAAIGVYRNNVDDDNDMKPRSHDDLLPDDIVIIDGCHAAKVHWDRFQLVAYRVNASWRRLAARVLLRLNFVFFVIGCVFSSLRESSFATAGAVFLTYSLVVMLSSPLLVKRLYMGRFWNTQPWFFGFEGYLDIKTIEEQIFGASFGRLKWSPAGSPLSRYRLDENQRIEALDPMKEEQSTSGKVQSGQQAEPGQRRLFTVVDTASMTVTMFEAERPPVALLVAATEGGMQRAIACSYDYAAETFYRETVLRVPTQLLAKMDRIARVKFGMKRPYREVHKLGVQVQAAEAVAEV